LAAIAAAGLALRSTLTAAVPIMNGNEEELTEGIGRGRKERRKVDEGGWGRRRRR
jgi:hypothetical protein